MENTESVISPKMAELVGQLRAGTHRLFLIGRKATRFDVDEQGRTSNGRARVSTTQALLSRGLIALSEGNEYKLTD